jgi:hypothetical protein
MRQIIPLLLCVTGLLLVLCLGAVPVSRAAADLTIDIFVHRDSPVQRLGDHELEALFTRTQTRWDDGKPVIPLSLPAGTEARVLFDRVILRLGPDEVGRFWLDHRIRGLGLPPKQVPNALLMQQVVANLQGAIGYAPAAPGRTGVKVVARIQQGRVVSL